MMRINFGRIFFFQFVQFLKQGEVNIPAISELRHDHFYIAFFHYHNKTHLAKKLDWMNVIKLKVLSSVVAPRSDMLALLHSVDAWGNDIFTPH